MQIYSGRVCEPKRLRGGRFTNPGARPSRNPGALPAERPGALPGNCLFLENKQKPNPPASIEHIYVNEEALEEKRGSGRICLFLFFPGNKQLAEAASSQHKLHRRPEASMRVVEVTLYPQGRHRRSLPGQSFDPVRFVTPLLQLPQAWSLSRFQLFSPELGNWSR